MDDSLTTLRIFISSPGDVQEERRQAERVVRELDSRFGPRVELEVILWEHLGIGADASFQEGINRLLEEGGGIDIAVFILWSRIGSEVGGKLRRDDGTRWKSGTQAEFYLMLEARNLSCDDPKRPEILAYVRNDDDGFRQRVVSGPSSEMEVLLTQKKALDQFLQVEFNDEKGRNLRAYHSYPEPVTFANQLEVHLRAIIDRLLGEEGSVNRWSGDPYRGLSAFDIEHADIFVGREQQVLLLENLFRDRHRQFLDAREESESGSLPFVVILGASGSGKSSLARAGFAAKLRFRNRDPSIRQWRVAAFIPTASEEGLALGLSRSLKEEIHGLSELNTPEAALVAKHLVESPAKLAEAGIDLATKEVGSEVRLLVVVDQLEELFSAAVSENDRDRFLDELLALAQSGRAWILATLRSDFFATAQRNDRFRRLKGRDGAFDLVPPSLDEIRRIISEPARMAGLRFEADAKTGRSVADLILEDATAGDTMGLPLLQDALQELYQRRDGEGRITLEAYRRMGGIRGCLQKRTETIVEALPAEESDQLPSLFRELVSIDADSGKAVRRRAPKLRLDRPPAMASLVERLSGTEARLLIASGDGEDATLSLAHEALIAAWPQLEAWIDANRKGLIDRAEAMRSCQRWEKSGRSRSLLLPGGEMLDAAINLQTRFPFLLQDGSNLEEFIEKSRQAHRRRRGIRIAALVSLVAVAGSFLWYASHQAAEERRLESERASAMRRLQSEIFSNRVNAFLENGDPMGALTLAASEQQQGFSSFGTRSATIKALGAIPRQLAGMMTVPDEERFLPREREMARGVLSIDWSPGGKEIAAGTRGGTVLVLDREISAVSRSYLPRQIEGLGAAAKAVGWVDEGVLAVIHEDGYLALHRESGSGEGTFEKIAEGIGRGGISVNGRCVVSEQVENRIRTVDSVVRGGKPADEVVEGRVTAIAVDDSGREVLALDGMGGRPAEIRFRWGDRSLSQPSGSSRVSSLAISPSHELLAAGAAGIGVELFSMGNGEKVGFLPWSESIISLDWHPVESTLAGTTGEGELLVWQLSRRVDSFGAVDFGQREPTLRIPAHQEAALSVSWSPDGRRLASGSDDGSVRLWEMNPEDPAFLVLPPGESRGPGFRGLAVSPDGRWVAGGGDDGVVSVWSMETMGLVGRPLAVTRSPLQSLAWHPSEPWLVAGGSRGEIQFSRWPEGTPFGGADGHGDSIWKLRWHPKGDSLFASSWDHLISVWNQSGGREDSWEGHQDYVQGLAISPDGSLLASGATDGSIWWWNTADGTRIRTWEGHGPGDRVAVCALDFSPDGELIASAGNDGRVILWEVETGRRIKVFEGHQGDVETVAFSPSGQLLASAGDDGTVWIWQRETLEPLFSYAAHRLSIANLCWMPGDGAIVISASADGSIHFLPCSPTWWSERLTLFDRREGKPLHQPPETTP